MKNTSTNMKSVRGGMRVGMALGAASIGAGLLGESAANAGGICTIGPTKRGKGSKLMVLADGQGIPVGVTVHSASPAEVTLVAPTLKMSRRLLGRLPQRLIADKGYDSDPLRAALAKRHIQQITPHRCNRRRAPRQDGRALRRYRRRWKIERTIAWLGNFRRLPVRYDRSLQIYRAFFHIACFMIVLRRVVQ